MRMDTRARVIESPMQWAMDQVTLVVADGDHFLMNDGTWRIVAEGEVIPDDAGICLPRRTVEVIAAAIADWQGHTSHADTEARVLREWLAVERSRVDGELIVARERGA